MYMNIMEQLRYKSVYICVCVGVCFVLADVMCRILLCGLQSSGRYHMFTCVTLLTVTSCRRCKYSNDLSDFAADTLTTVTVIGGHSLQICSTAVTLTAISHLPVLLSDFSKMCANYLCQWDQGPIWKKILGQTSEKLRTKSDLAKS